MKGAEEWKKKRDNQLVLKISPEYSEGVYSNIVLIAHSPSEFILDFARILPGLQKAKVFSRIIMTPQNAHLLKEALEDNLKKNMKKDLARSKSLAKKKKKLVLNKIINFFARSSYKSFFVGGIIRDMILNQKIKDIDIAIEGDAIKLGHCLNKRLKGEIKTHREFGTIEIIKDSVRIDLATARKEIYVTPGALPIVAPAKIYDDLKRRDFTMNAIAISISKKDFGKIIDPFNGIADIKNRLIRILHRRSFIDDPTRTFRALRYKNRLGFMLEKNTEKLLTKAISEGKVKNISMQRLLNELRSIFSEKNYQKTIADLIKYRMFRLNESKLKHISRMGSIKYYFFFLFAK